jgi:hypothetical protein
MVQRRKGAREKRRGGEKEWRRKGVEEKRGCRHGAAPLFSFSPFLLFLALSCEPAAGRPDLVVASQ